MSDTESLLKRIEAEFQGAEDKIKQYQAATLQEYADRELRLEQFARVCEQLREVWRPRLETLAEKFHERVKVTPSVSKTRRSAKFEFQSPLAIIELTFAAMTDSEVRNLVLDYNLHVLPILMKFDGKQQLELPLENVDPNIVGQWIDDRIVDMVRTYLQLHQCSYYLKGHLVRDPIAHVEFPKYAAAATLEWNGTTQYFIGQNTRDEFARQNNLTT